MPQQFNDPFKQVLCVCVLFSFPTCSMRGFFCCKTLNKFFYWIIVDLQCCVSFTCAAKGLSYTWIHCFPLFSFFYGHFSHIGYYRVLSRGPCAVQQVIIYFIFSSVYMSVPVSQFIPLLSLGNHKFFFFLHL